MNDILYCFVHVCTTYHYISTYLCELGYMYFRVVIKYFRRLAMSCFRYLTLERYCPTNQYVEYNNLYIIHGKSRNNVLFYLEKIDKPFKLQHLLWEYSYFVDSLVSTILYVFVIPTCTVHEHQWRCQGHTNTNLIMMH